MPGECEKLFFLALFQHSSTRKWSRKNDCISARHDMQKKWDHFVVKRRESHNFLFNSGSTARRIGVTGRRGSRLFNKELRWPWECIFVPRWPYLSLSSRKIMGVFSKPNPTAELTGKFFTSRIFKSLIYHVVLSAFIVVDVLYLQHVRFIYNYIYFLNTKLNKRFDEPKCSFINNSCA